MSGPNPGVRIGDAEREATVTALGEHFAAGRLDRDEFDERAARAYAARTAGELPPLFADLPAPHPFAPRASRPVAGPASTRRSGSGRSSRASRLPLVPLLVVALVVMIVTNVGWPLFLLAFGLWWMSRSFARQRGGGWGCGGHSSGSERASRGSWA